MTCQHPTARGGLLAPCRRPASTMFEVYGLRDFQPYALACRSCCELVLAVVHGAHAVPAADAPHDCELFYEGVCDDK